MRFALALMGCGSLGPGPRATPQFADAQAPLLTTKEIDGVMAFRCARRDGYDPQHRANYRLPAVPGRRAVTPRRTYFTEPRL